MCHRLSMASYPKEPFPGARVNLSQYRKETEANPIARRVE
jgi:hypothetical protein